MTTAAVIDDVAAPRRSVTLPDRSARTAFATWPGPFRPDERRPLLAGRPLRVGAGRDHRPVRHRLEDVETPAVATETGSARRPGALADEAVGPTTYRGFWTFEPSRVDAVRTYVAGTYPESS